MKNVGKVSSASVENICTIMMKNPSRASDIGTTIGSAVVSRDTKAVLSTVPDLIGFYHAGKRFFFWESLFR